MTEDTRQELNTGPAEALEEFLVPTIFGPWAAEVVERASPRPGEGVLDVGCGTGPAARTSAGYVGPSGRVDGLDFDEAMLEVGKRCAERDGQRVNWHKADVVEMPFDDAHFDVALCCQGLQFFHDKRAALGEIHRVLKPEGRLVASIWRDVTFCPGHLAVASALAALSGSEPAPMPPFSLSDAAEIGSLAEQAGFRAVNVTAVKKLVPFESAAAFVDALAGGAPSTRRALEALDEAAMASVISSVTGALREFTNAEGLQLPTESHILEARV